MATVRKVSPGPWQGYDFGGKRLEMSEGGQCEMSDRRAEVLLRDFPGGFEVVGAADSTESASAAGDLGGSAPTVSVPEAARCPNCGNAVNERDSCSYCPDPSPAAPDVPRATRRRGRR